MNFGPLQIVTAWRLTRMGVLCQAIVMDGTDGVRLVVIEDQQIVEWTRFNRIFDLRQYVGAAFAERRRAGWQMASDECESPVRRGARIGADSRRRARVPPGLLAISERSAS